jgi:hypothetical protein
VLRFVRLRSTPPNAGASAPPPSSTSLAQCMRMSAAQIRAAPPFARTSARRWRRSDVPGTYRARDIRQEQPAPIARTGRSSPEVLKQAWLAGVPISTVAAPSNQSQTIIVPLACAPVCPDLNRAPTPDTTLRLPSVESARCVVYGRGLSPSHSHVVANTSCRPDYTTPSCTTSSSSEVGASPRRLAFGQKP